MNKGFTLIELLVVVAIIGILSAIALVNFQLATQRAESVECLSNLRTLGIALNSYAIDFNSYPAADGYGEQNMETQFGEGPAGNGYWSAVPMILYNLGYVTNKKVFWCPTLYKRYPGRRQYLRYAMNGASWNNGGPFVKPGMSGNYWMASCIYINSQWSSNNSLPWPHGHDHDSENVLIHTGKPVTLKTPWVSSFDDPKVQE